MTWRVLVVSMVVLSLIAMGYPQSVQQPGSKQSPAPSGHKVNRRIDGHKQTSSTRKRNLPKLQDPEATALLIHLVDRYAKNLSDKTELDKRVEQELSKEPGSRETARRMMANFRSIPLPERQAVLGRWADISAEAKVTTEQYRTAFERLAKSAKKPQPATSSDEHAGRARTNLTPKHYRSEKDNRKQPGPRDRKPGERTPDRRQPNTREPGDLSAFVWQEKSRPFYQAAFPAVYVKARPQQDRYVLRYEGMWCHSETDGDFGDSDEIYIVTQVIDSRGDAWRTTHPRPHEPDLWYEDVDHNGTRTGPRRRCWGGQDGKAAQDLTLIVTAFEQDNGDVDEVAASLAAVGSVAWVICGVLAWASPAVPAAVAAACAVAIVSSALLLVWDFFSGGSDDLISVETVSITAHQIRDWADQPPRLSRRGNIPYHFSTVHVGKGNAAGADYHFYFTVAHVGR